MKLSWLAVIFFFLSFAAIAQQMDSYGPYSAEIPLNKADSIYLVQLPKLTVPEELRGEPLPPVVDNSQLPYLRPVFQQEGSSCSQACLVGYNFTYEIDRLRNVDAGLLQNQYATHFTYNFMNGGNGWFGVSYFHSMEVLRLCGNMNCVDYGGTFYDNGTRWISGYNVYYHAMFNRINGAYSIYTGDAEGIMTLKQWLFNHLEGSPYGGVASFYANTPWNAHILNDTTPEGGKHVVTGWYPSATHAMTIVGYNDSIRWDYNNDGQYTNNIDLNGDEVIDARDWEIGAVKFVNSHGLDAQDSGFCYMMYKVLAETFDNGGIWNRSVHVLDIKENYEPLLTFKVRLKHNYREKVRVRAGITADTASRYPDFIMDFPIIDFQGSNYPMQGLDTAESQKTIEFGLDVTPLRSYARDGAPARYFLMVDENDPNEEGTGSIVSFSLMDYAVIPAEIICPGLPHPLEENGLTMASVVHEASISRPEITTSTLPPFTTGSPYSQQLAAAGGNPPYSWEMVSNYMVTSTTESYAPVTANRILPDPGLDSIISVPLGFGFPYFGKVYDTVFLHVNGYLQFRHEQLPEPYMQDQLLFLKQNRIIAPLTNDAFGLQPADDDGAWYERDSQHATFRWKLSWAGNPFVTEMDFSVTLLTTGEIIFNFGNISPEHYKWASGISDGDSKNYFFSPAKDPGEFHSGKCIQFTPCPAPPGITLSRSGLLSGTPSQDGSIYDMLFRVTDNNSISSTRSLQFSSGPAISFELHSGNDNIIGYSDTVALDATVVNRESGTLTYCNLSLSLDDPYMDVIQAAASIGTLSPGEEVTLDSSFIFVVSHDVPDGHPFWLNIELDAMQGTWLMEIPQEALAPDLRFATVEVLDGNDGILEPGETAQVAIKMTNDGHLGLTNITGLLDIDDAAVELLSSPELEFGNLANGSFARDTFTVHASEAAFSGSEVLISLHTDNAQQLLQTDSIFLQVGKKPVLVIDLNPHPASGPVIYQTLQDLGIISDYNTLIPANLRYYQSLFICLGYGNSYRQLTWQEGKLLANYLDGGGRIYMEGRQTWSGGILTPVHDRFRILPAGASTFFDQVEGIGGTFTEGISMANGADQTECSYWLTPMAPAFDILLDNANQRSCAVAHDQGTYRTIGTIFELGTLVDDASPSTKADLIIRFLNFFGIDYSLTTVPDPAAAVPGATVILYPNPSSGQVTFRFEVPENGCLTSLYIYDIQGRLIATPLQGKYISAGIHELSWNLSLSSGDKVADGIYIYRCTIGNEQIIGKLIVGY